MPATKKKISQTQLEGDALLKAVNKKYGEGTIGYASDPSLRITRVPSGIMPLDYILNGGWARGRHAELYGSFSVGKTLTTLLTIATAQEMGLKCAFFDAEKSFDPVFAEHLGVDLNKLVFPLRKRRTGEEIVNIMEALLYASDFDVMVLDSIASLLPKKEQEEVIEKESYGTYQARLMSKALRKLTTANQDTVLIYINQLRDSIGSMFAQSVTSGGRAMSFYAGTRVEFSKAEDIKETRTMLDARTIKTTSKQVKLGHRILVRLAKDKTGAQPWDEASFVFNYETQKIDHEEELLYLGRRMGLVKSSGGASGPETLWVASNPSKKSKGRKNFKKYLASNPSVALALEEAILEGGEE